MRAVGGGLVCLLVCGAIGGCATGGLAYDAGGQGGGSADAGLRGDAGALRDGSVDAGGPVDGSGGPRDGGPPPMDAPAIVVACGDRVIDAPELCDDGNTLSGDGCSADCRSVECSGSGTYEDPVTHHCYWRDSDVLSRVEASGRCSYRGGHLIRWATTGERDAAYAATVGGPGGRVWIGLRRVGGAWTWDDGEASTTVASDFRSGEPSGDGDCVEWGPGNSLNDVPCDVERDLVCEREPAGTRR